MSLREEVVIKTITGELRGHLIVGHDLLPELEIPPPGGYWGTYRPATFPAAWSIRASNTFPGLREAPLLEAWDTIMDLQKRLAEAERQERDHVEKEDGETEEEELYQANARERGIENRISQELAEADHATA